MPGAQTLLEQLAERFAHPSVRVMTRELSQRARELERGALAWPLLPQPPAQHGAVLPGLESLEAALGKRRWFRRLAVDQSDWRSFARVIQDILSASSNASQQSAAGAPHPASVIALRLVWGAERFAELPTVMLKPPAADFLAQLAHLPAPKRGTPPEELDQAVASWLQERSLAIGQQSAFLPGEDVRGFARVVAACRVVGHLRKALALEDVAAGYLAWARLLRANPQQLTDISSGWWSSTDRQSGRQPRR